MRSYTRYNTRRPIAIIMPFSEKVRVMLYSRSGNKCAFPDCPVSLVFRLADSVTVVNIGEAAHIVAEQEDGPRGSDPLPLAERNDFDNGLILCSPHHTIIDGNPVQFPVTVLRQWKAAHEVKYGSSADPNKARDEQLYAEYVDHWIVGAHVRTWTLWTQNLLIEGGQSIEEKIFDDVQATSIWLLQRYWPNRCIQLEGALANFRRVCDDLRMVLMKHSAPYGKFIRTEKFYKNYRRVLQRERMRQEYEFHVRLVDDLTLELTRAANLVCDRVRESLDATFRVHEGALVARSGMYENFSHLVHRVEYTAQERTHLEPYPGLEQFMQARSGRDYVFGVGARRDYLAEDKEPPE
jgi:hypothetical protein